MKRLLENLIGKIVNKGCNMRQNYLYDIYRKRYQINNSFNFNGEGILMYGNGIIVIKNDSYIGRYSTLQSSGNAKIEIGKFCKIGPFFSVWTHSSEVDCDYLIEDEIKPKIGNVIIEDGVWIGANVVITPGVTVGENSIIGANSVVTKNVPPYGIVGGVPARLIRYKEIKKV